MQTSRSYPRMYRFWLFLLIGCGLFLMCVDGMAAGQTDASRPYRLGPGDILSMEVLHEPDYRQTDILVHPDGHITITGVGEIQAANQTLDAVTQAVQSKLGEYLVDPHVRLSVTHTRPAVVYLSGAVMHPGMFQFNTDDNESGFHVSNADTQARTELRLLNILSNAGGVMLDADLSRIGVRSAQSGKTREINLWPLLTQGDASRDIPIEPGDSIIVPRLQQGELPQEQYAALLRSSIGPRTFPVRVIGEVNKPGVYELNGTSPSLGSALAFAGGLAPQAQKKTIAIHRFDVQNQERVISTPPDNGNVPLRPNDILVVGEQKTYHAGRWMEQAAKILSPFQALGWAAAGASQLFGIGGWRD